MTDTICGISEGDVVLMIGMLESALTPKVEFRDGDHAHMERSAIQLRHQCITTVIEMLRYRIHPQTRFVIPKTQHHDTWNWQEIAKLAWSRSERYGCRELSETERREFCNAFAESHDVDVAIARVVELLNQPASAGRQVLAADGQVMEINQ